MLAACERGAEFVRGGRLEIGLRSRARRGCGEAQQQARVVESRELTHQREARTQRAAGLLAEPSFDQRLLERGRVREVLEKYRDVGQRVVAVRRLPVDEPEPL